MIASVAAMATPVSSRISYRQHALCVTEPFGRTVEPRPQMTARHQVVAFERRLIMSVARVVEISATSTKSFEDAVVQGIARANQTLRNVKSAWIKEQEAKVDDGKVVAYKVNLKVTFVLDGAA